MAIASNIIPKNFLTFLCHSIYKYTTERKAYEYFKTKAIFIDIVIINRENERYKDVITHKIEQELYRMNTLYNFYSTPGRVYVLDSSEVTPEEDILFNMIARLRFDTNKTASLEESIAKLQQANAMGSYEKRVVDRAKEDPNYKEEDIIGLKNK